MARRNSDAQATLRPIDRISGVRTEISILRNHSDNLKKITKVKLKPVFYDASTLTLQSVR